MSIRDEIYEYDIKLSTLKMELNNLTKAYLDDPRNNSKFLSSKINSMKQEISAISYQLDILKQALSNYYEKNNMQEEAASFSYNTATNESTQNVIQENISSDYSNTNPIQKETLDEYISTQQNEYDNYDNLYKTRLDNSSETNINHQSIPNLNSSKPQKDLENTIGKSFMGILASILIFISFILFAKLLYPLFSEGFKIFAMYAISLGFLLFGYSKLKKKPENKLYLSLTGCGVGALYLSLIISNVYFQVIGDITLYLLIFAWAIFTAYLSRLRSSLFATIGQIGITISLIFGCNICLDSNDVNKFFILNIFFIAASFLFKTSKIYSKNFANNLFSAINLFIMTNCYLEFLSGDSSLLIKIIPYILSAFIIFKLFTSYTIYNLENESIGLPIFNNLYILAFFSILESMLPSTFNFYIVILCVATFFLIINEIRLKSYLTSDGMNLYQILLMIYMYVSCFNLSFINDYIGLSILALPFLFYGLYKKDNTFQISGLIALTIYIFQNSLFGPLHFIIGLLAFALITYFMIVKKETANNIKPFSYILFLLFGSFYINKWFSINFELALFVFLSISNLIVAKSSLCKNFSTNEDDMSMIALTRFLNACFMIWSLYMIPNSLNTSTAAQFLVILVSFGLFMANTRNLLKTYPGLGAGMYISAKFTVFMLVILNSWQASNIVISICLLLFAILMIIIGFIFKEKSFRIYGLGLTMLSTVKLIMIDIHYDNSLGNALSFFISGILCFAISALYNFLDKTLLRNDK